MQINIPSGTKIDTTKNENIIRIKIPNTQYWILGEKVKNNKWNIFLINLKTRYKSQVEKNIPTRAFITVSNMILKAPFPINGKINNQVQIIKQLINNIYKTYVKKQRKSSKV